MSSPSGPSKLSFEEFKLYYESTEKVTDRRLDTNRWNHSICVASLIAVAIIVKWSISSRPLFWIGLVAADFLCVMAAVFCVLWRRQIDDFKHLNNAKFSVLNEMAPRVEFSLEKPGEMVSYDPFAKEWAKMQGLKALAPVGRRRIVALRSSTAEYFLPRAFTVLFSGVFLALTLALDQARFL